jgi:phenylpropionate dioxygenase-like ring-hydroxylating dioxygenase large terminal subunit
MVGFAHRLGRRTPQRQNTALESKPDTGKIPHSTGENMTAQFPAIEASNARPQQELISGGYLRNAWYVAAWSDDIADGRLVHRTIMDEPIVLYRKANGAVAAIEDRCAHRFAPLSMGKIVGGDRIQCPYHGLEFDGSGACVRNPHGAKNIPARARVKSYCVAEKHKAVWIWMGEAPADEAKVPDFAVLDNVPEIYTTKRDSITIRANYQLIIDNLLDLSHTSYLHEGILGNADTVESEITVEQDGDDVVVGRHATNSAPPGMFAQFWPDHPPRVDKFTNMRWMAPSTLRLVTGICRMGASPDSGTGYHAIHMLTPENERSTLYHFTAVRFGVMTTDEKLNRDLQAKIAQMRRFAFAEQDAPVIEAQQRVIESADRPLDPITLSVDVGPVRYKRILDKMRQAERA